MRFAIIEEGVVQNTAHALAPLASNWVHDPDGLSAKGDLWDGKAFVRPQMSEPDPVVPDQITRAQGKAALIEVGLWAAVLAHVAAIDDDTQRALAEVALNDTQYWSRSSPFLNAAAGALGLPSETLDALFVRAGEILL